MIATGWPRVRQQELMDQPGLRAEDHRRALAGLCRINQISRTASYIWRPLEQLARQVEGRKLRVLDLACGGGDVLMGCAHRLVKRGLAVELHGVDQSETAIDAAQTLSRQAGLKHVRFSRLDVLSDALPEDYDVVMSTLFFHHLADDQAALLLSRMAAAARRAVLIDDLLRSRFAYGLAWLACHTLTRSPIVRFDGPVSVRAAFTVSELRDLCGGSGMSGATFTRHWPARVLIQWNKP
ncbi:MAG: methyltransferase domain-containing protein [Planctomycetia bacterium]|nr:methyltransferase domain-containing protein [Planctomycetia bacterium]